jgi:hypothetical protein
MQSPSNEARLASSPAETVKPSMAELFGGASLVTVKNE